jgi:hypothetical protein
MYFYCYVYVFLLLCMFCSVHSVSLCCSTYCLCTDVYYTTATGCQPNCSLYIYIYTHKIRFSAALRSRVTMAFHYGASISTKALMLIRVLRLSKRCSWIPLLLGYRHLLLDVCCPTSNWTMKWKDTTTADLQQIRSGTADGNELAQVRPVFYSAQLNFIALFPQHLSQISTSSPQWVLGFFFPREYSGRVVAVTTNPPPHPM